MGPAGSLPQLFSFPQAMCSTLMMSPFFQSNNWALQKHLVYKKSISILCWGIHLNETFCNLGHNPCAFCCFSRGNLLFIIYFSILLLLFFFQRLQGTQMISLWSAGDSNGLRMERSSSIFTTRMERQICQDKKSQRNLKARQLKKNSGYCTSQSWWVYDVHWIFICPYNYWCTKKCLCPF